MASRWNTVGGRLLSALPTDGARPCAGQQPAVRLLAGRRPPAIPTRRRAYCPMVQVICAQGLAEWRHDAWAITAHRRACALLLQLEAEPHGRRAASSGACRRRAAARATTAGRTPTRGSAAGGAPAARRGSSRAACPARLLPPRKARG